MRGTLPIVGTLAFCVVSMVSIVGCRTSGQGNEASMSQAPACETTPAVVKNVEGVTTAPGSVDATKPVSEPNESTSPARPPIVYGWEPNILPLADGQVERVKKLVAAEQPGKEIWFIHVMLNRKTSDYRGDVYNYRVDVYCKPDQQSARVRRGAGVYAGLSGRVLPPIIHPFSYAHLCETDAGFSSDLGVPDDPARLPFRVSGDISDEEMIEVVGLIRSGVSAPKPPPYGSRERADPTIVRQQVLDPAASIHAISRQGEEISVDVPGPQPHAGQIYCCRKIDGVWTLVKTGGWIE